VRRLRSCSRKARWGNVYNVGADNERTNLEIVKLILNVLEKPHSLIRYVTDRPGHDRRYAIDNAKIKSKLGFEPKKRFQQAIEETVKWYVDNRAWWEKIKTGEYWNITIRVRSEEQILISISKFQTGRANLWLAGYFRGLEFYWKLELGIWNFLYEDTHYWKRWLIGSNIILT